MYIAFKWLLGLTLTMWVTVCCLNLVIGTQHKTQARGLQANNYSKNDYFTNSSIARKKSENYISSSKYSKLRNNVSKYKVIETAYLHYAMFLAAAVVLGMVNHKSKIFIFNRDKFAKINIKTHISKLENGSKFCLLSATTVSSAAIRGCLSMSRKLGRSMTSCFIRKSPSGFNNTWVHLILIKRLEDIVEEKNRLAQLLLTCVQESKNLKKRNHFETVTKNRLMKLIEDSQVYLKEFKARYASLQNLNVTSHQENISLKSRINKLQKEKLEAEQTLTALVRKIYESKNAYFISLCQNLSTDKDSVQNVELRNEIRKLLEKPTVVTTDTTETDLLPTSSLTALQPKIQMNNGDRVIPFVCMKPSPKGHNGEYLWTVKDHDGLIERIYEYDNFESDYDNGDMIRRIREYSVFCDKDCILDGKGSRTIFNERSDFMRFKIADEKFLTGSEAFQTFLRNNKSLVTTPSTPRRSSLICG